jgi:hypothetical protein
MLVFASCISSAAAQDLGVRSLGIRVGGNINPDQFDVGLHLDAGNFHPKVRFQPSFDFGFGDDTKLIMANLDALYLFSARPWRPYLGGGLGISFFDKSGGSGFDAGAALNLVGGIEWGKVPRGSRASRRYLFEVRIGVGDAPDLKLLFGFNI